MENLKMRFKLHELEFEIEGNEATVKQEFASFKAFITEDLLSKINITTPQGTTIAPTQSIKGITPSEDVTAIELYDYPAMKEIVKRDLPKTESDWVLIYCLYASQFGENPFTEEDIKKLYEQSGRRNNNRFANFSNNLKAVLNKGFIKILNDKEYIIKEDGTNYSRQILAGNSTSKVNNKKSSKGKSTSSDIDSQSINKKGKGKGNKTNSVGFIDLKLTPAEQNSLTDFFAVKNPKTQNEKVIVAMKWFIDNKNVTEVSMEEMNYLLSIAAETPSALAQVLGNMVGVGFRWVTKGEIGKYQLSSIGENYLMNKLPKKSK